MARAHAPLVRWGGFEPARHDRFVGRAVELRRLVDALAEGERLVTVCGPPGIGKTRLVAEFARATASAPDAAIDVLFCDLSSARDATDLCVALATAVGAPQAADDAADDLAERLGEVLRASAPLLVVLDDFDAIARAGCSALSVLRSRAPDVRFVVTSRERLQLPGERCLELDPLAVPDLAAASPSAVAASPAVELFVARSRAVRFDYEVTEVDAPQVAAIVRQLDGIPLAIELCAARMGVLDPAQLLAHLAGGLDVLAAKRRGPHGRPETLRGAIDASWALLDEDERSAFARCSVFRGGFSLEAAAAVIAPAAGPHRAAVALDLLDRLHAKSLIRSTPCARMPGERRLRMLASLGAYAAEKLDVRRERAAAVARHAAFFVELGERWAAAAGEVEGPERHRRLAVEAENLTAVAEAFLAEPVPDGTQPDERGETAPPAAAGPAERATVALRALLALESVLLVCAKGRLGPYVAMLDAALAVPGVDGSLRARAVFTRAMADFVRGRIPEAVLHFRAALELAQAAGEARVEAMTRAMVGLFLSHAGQPDAAAGEFAATLAVAAARADVELEALGHLVRGGAHLWAGAVDLAERDEARAALLFRARGDRHFEAMATGLRAIALLDLGRVEEAEARVHEGLALLHDVEERRIEGYLAGVLGRALQAHGDFERAREALERALATHRAVGDRWSEAVHLGYLGHLALETGAADAAAKHYEAAIARLDGLPERQYTAIFTAGLAAASARLDRRASAEDRIRDARSLLDGLDAPATAIVVEAFARLVDLSGAIDVEGDALRLAVALRDAPPSEDARVALRIVAALAPALASEPRTLELGQDARWLRVGRGPVVELLKSRAQRFVLERLARERVESPGQALTLADLFEAGWPGERALEKAADNRVYVTIARLKKLGLDAVLQRRDDGFLLAADVELIRPAGPPPPRPPAPGSAPAT